MEKEVTTDTPKKEISAQEAMEILNKQEQERRDKCSEEIDFFDKFVEINPILKDLEDLALSYPGVVKTYAIQAGRELRVIVGAEKVTDNEANQLAFDISNRIQNEMTYPGQIKITVIRETRAISYAK